MENSRLGFRFHDYLENVMTIGAKGWSLMAVCIHYIGPDKSFLALYETKNHLQRQMFLNLGRRALSTPPEEGRKLGRAFASNHAEHFATTWRTMSKDFWEIP
ncbi:unnamed protein product [Arabis nemorensis]|uniref:Uncharacterized protein n=1 Tax=Arabis nemorensis TaxID=586526 RepID=A0A565BC40_9BRAS|nr:unnamed protein product [Arabis nemorensis]